MPKSLDDHRGRSAEPHADRPKLVDIFALGLGAVLFDLDGVVTRTASLHARAWQCLFDEFLAERAQGGSFAPFRLPEDYLDHVDGKPRYAGVRSFLLSRSIDLPYGAPSALPSTKTICGLGNRKDNLFTEVLDKQGVEVFEDTLAFIGVLRARAIKTACVTSSKNGRPVLEQAALAELFDLIYDGNDLEREQLLGKPNPDSFLRAAELVGVDPDRAAVVEDAIAGVAAGRAGRFRLVIGIDRGAGEEALRRAGADVVVSELSELAVETTQP
jgi:beta-phosphoglucomutase family hydrolase